MEPPCHPRLRSRAQALALPRGTWQEGSFPQASSGRMGKGSCCALAAEGASQSKEMGSGRRKFGLVEETKLSSGAPALPAVTHGLPPGGDNRLGPQPTQSPGPPLTFTHGETNAAQLRIKFSRSKWSHPLLNPDPVPVNPTNDLNK